MIDQVLLFVMLGATGASGCALAQSEQASLGATVSAALIERAQEHSVPEHRVGALAVLQREDACDLLTQGADLLPETERALEQECSWLIPLAPGTEAEYLAALRTPIVKRRPTLVSVAWAERSETASWHVVLVADGVDAVRIIWPGYGRVGAGRVTCERSPWPLAAADPPDPDSQ